MVSTIQLLTYKDISERTGLTVAALQQRQHRGRMPPPDVKTSPRVALWYPATIEEWLESESTK